MAGEGWRRAVRWIRLPRHRWTKALLAAAVVVLLVSAGATAYVAQVASRFNANVHRSDALARGMADETPSASPSSSVPKLSKDTNILIMGLDSRLDENGQPLPQDIQDALHAGDDSAGFYNANVLMLVHVPADGSRSTAISIPRDDYVKTAGFSGAGFKTKIKEAYSYGFAIEEAARQEQGKPYDYQAARDAGRAAQIATVSKFLGGVRIDHFVEVTMVAFYQVALAIQPITVCVNHATQDTFSGADFKAGVQQINAQQAMAFVRQRRDTSDPTYDFNDLDRTRRQQAFIVSVLHQLKQAGTLTNLPRMESVLDAVSKNMAVDRDLDLLMLAQQASSLTGGNVSFTTLPIVRFGTAPDGASVNVVDVEQVQGIVRDLLAPQPQRTTTPSPTAASTSPGSEASSGQAQPGATDPVAGTTGGETGSGGGDAPSSAGAGESASASSAPSPSTYTDWQGALQGGSVPCVK
ncbi:hypothetical protein GCM10027449_03520 [Sinomonas notoginsengisoli]|uniref:LCP family protein n=1 Tax=Sinomonas notoginsengisoli TaxID=1457311 RepID=UPI001F1DE7E8|nr:LCP family protein [Sinomonas notoginsengisoli]